MTDPLIDDDGTQKWYKDGKLHREDGPAIIRENGGQKWYRSGELHREDGPAVIYYNGDYEWHIHNIEYTFADYCDKLGIRGKDRILLRSKYG